LAEYPERDNGRGVEGEVSMKTLTVRLPDDVYERVRQRAAARGATLDQEVTELLERFAGADDGVGLAAARERMEELFRTVTGFRMGPKIPREDLYDRGRVR
jgi:plasmid stability protein